MELHPLLPEQKRQSGSYRNSVAYAFGIVLLGGYLWHCLALNYVIDDSFITFRYVRNFVNGNGLVFNPGERVEGYTNFLWAILLSPFLYAKRDLDLLLVAQVLGIVFGAATILLVIRFPTLVGRRFGPLCLVAGAFLASSSSFCAWSTGGLETTFFTFLLFAGVYAYIYYLQTGRKPFLAPAIYALATMTRPEGVLILVLTFLHLAVTEFRAVKRLISKRMLLWVAVFAAIYLPYYCWRFSYYGYPLPNTFYAKVGAGPQQYLRGIRYLADFLTWRGLVFLLPLPLVLKTKRESWVNFFILLIATYAAFIIYVGGDGLAFFRFAVPILPFIYLLAQEGFREAYDWTKRRILSGSEWKSTAIACLLLAPFLGLSGRQSLHILWSPDTHRWHESQSDLNFPGNGRDHTYLLFDNYFVDRQAMAARWLQANASPGASVASTPAGSIAYNMNLKVVDMLGLNDVHIAHSRGPNVGSGRAGHEKGDGNYVLSLAPDYILLGNVAVFPKQLSQAEMIHKLVRKSEHEIWNNPEFHNRYELVSVKLNDAGPFQYFTFYRKKSIRS